MPAFIAVFAWISLASALSSSALGDGLLRTIDGNAPAAATLVQIDSSEIFTFRGASGEVATNTAFEAKDLVRWGEPPQPPLNPYLLLADGSEIILEGPDDVGMVENDRLFFRTVLFGEVSLPLEAVRAIVLDAPAERDQRQKLVGRLVQNKTGPDEILLTNGDVLRGRFIDIDENTITCESNLRRRIVPRDRTAMIVLDTKFARQRSGQVPAIIVGFRDGHQLVAESIDLDADQLTLELLGGATFVSSSFVRPLEDRIVQFIQPLGQKLVYLSDLKPSGYKHVPFLSGDWPYQTDRDLALQPLCSSARCSAKGIAMHSASRLTYELDERFIRFDAELGIADSESTAGSVVYRVFVRDAGQWHEAYKSPVLRQGDQPHACQVPVDHADALSLVVDFADRADQGDHALWLDARLLRP